MSEQQEESIQPKKYIRNFSEEGREKQKIHLENIRKKAMEKKRELKEITLKAKLMKLEPKIELAKQYDDYVNNKIQYQQQQQEEEPVYITKPTKEKKKKIIYKEVEEEEEEEEIVYIKKNKPKPHQPHNGDMPVGRETLDRTLYKSSTEQLHMRAVEERIRHNLTSCYSALIPREY